MRQPSLYASRPRTSNGSTPPAPRIVFASTPRRTIAPTSRNSQVLLDHAILLPNHVSSVYSQVVTAPDAIQGRALTARHPRLYSAHYWLYTTGRARYPLSSPTIMGRKAYQQNHLRRKETLPRQTSAQPQCSKYGLCRRRRRSHAFPRAPCDAMPGATLVEDAERRERAKQIPHIPPSGDLGGMDSHSAFSPEKKWWSSPVNDFQIFGQHFSRSTMTRA